MASAPVAAVTASNSFGSPALSIEDQAAPGGPQVGLQQRVDM